MQTLQAIWTWCLAHPAIFYYLLASLIAGFISRRTQVETWCAAHPWANVMLQRPRRFGFDLWGLIAALQVLVESRAKVPPIVRESTNFQTAGDELIKTTTKMKIEVVSNIPDQGPPGAGCSSCSTPLALLLVASFGFAGQGCAGTFDQANTAGMKLRTATPPTLSTADRCQSLSERQYWFTGASILSGAIATTAATLTLPSKSEGLDTALILTAAGAGVVTVGTGWLGASAGADYVRECK
jgi:hypothetical protein